MAPIERASSSGVAGESLGGYDAPVVLEGRARASAWLEGGSSGDFAALTGAGRSIEHRPIRSGPFSAAPRPSAAHRRPRPRTARRSGPNRVPLAAVLAVWAQHASLSVEAAPTSGAFDRAAKEATPIDGLGRFLERVLGACDGVDEDRVDRRVCDKKAEEAREALEGRLLLFESSELAGRFSAPEWDPRKRRYRVLWTPIFGERGLGLTVGRPSRLDSAGNPVLERRALWVDRPSNLPEFIFRRDLERGMVDLELLIVAGDTWRLRRRGGPDVRGLEVELRGLRLRTRSGILVEELHP